LPKSRRAIAPATKAQSATLRAITPDRVEAVGHQLHAQAGNGVVRGLKPTTPQKAAGRMTLPPVCVPRATGKNPAATPAAEPLLEPPGVRVSPCGLAVGPALRVANSVVTVLPMTTPPAARVQATEAASARGGDRPKSANYMPSAYRRYQAHPSRQPECMQRPGPRGGGGLARLIRVDVGEGADLAFAGR